MSDFPLTTALWPTFEKQLNRLGRWYSRRLSQLGVPKMIGFMEGRLLTFQRQRSRARRAGHLAQVEWLNSRIKRWEAGIRWMARNSDRLGQHVMDQLHARAEAEKHKWESRTEDFERWRTHRAARKARSS
ncbi:MAG: hypothetical protein B7733_15480 [Myxococcales bacterium FL481]|nr:MAG: hypothetical protein B7733_15480 [Myxococcales bacterium FL481]